MTDVPTDLAGLLRTAFRYALALTHDESLADDVLQEACLGLISAGGPWNERYLLTAVRARFVDHCRGAQRAAVAGRVLRLDAVEAEARAAADREDDRSLLHEALGRLRYEEREVLFLHAVVVVLATTVLLLVLQRATGRSVQDGMPRVVAVQFHADWCRPSREISPRVDELRQRYGDEGVLFVEVDLTSDQTRRQAGYLMQALGLEAVWERQNGRTGELLLIDRTEGRVLSTFDHQDAVPLMAADLDRLLHPS